MTVSVSTDLQKQFTSVLTAALLSLTSLLTILYVEEVEASVTGDLSIMQSTPTQDDFIPAYAATYFEVKVTNNDNSASDLRNLDWYVCLGIKVANSCMSNNIDTGEIEEPTFQGGLNMEDLTSGDTEVEPESKPFDNVTNEGVNELDKKLKVTCNHLRTCLKKP